MSPGSHSGVQPGSNVMGIWAPPSVLGNNQLDTLRRLLPEAFALEVLTAQGKGREGGSQLSAS